MSDLEALLIDDDSQIGSYAQFSSPKVARPYTMSSIRSPPKSVRKSSPSKHAIRNFKSVSSQNKEIFSFKDASHHSTTLEKFTQAAVKSPPKSAIRSQELSKKSTKNIPKGMNALYYKGKSVSHKQSAQQLDLRNLDDIGTSNELNSTTNLRNQKSMQQQYNSTKRTAPLESANSSSKQQFSIRLKSANKTISATGRGINDTDNPDNAVKKAGKQLNFAKTCLKSLLNHSFVDENMSKLLKTVVSHLTITLDSAYTRVILNPDVETVLVDHLVESQVGFVKLIRNIQKEYQSLKSQADSMFQDAKKFSNEAKEAKQKEKRQYWDLKVALSVPESEKEYQKLSTQLKQKLDKSERVWNVEKSRYEAEIENLRNRVNEIENKTQFQNLKSEYERFKDNTSHRIASLEAKNDKKQNRIYKLEFDLSQERNNRMDIQNQYEKLEEQYNSTVNDLNQLIQEHDELESEMISFRESYFMLKEEERVIKIKLRKSQDDHRKLSDKYLKAQNKADTLQKESEKYAGINTEEYDLQNALLRPFKLVFSGQKKPLLFTNLNHLTKSMLPSALDQKPQNANNDAVNLSRFSLFKPNFVVFVEKSIEQKLDNPFASNQLIQDKELFVMVRAIFDSKYNEYMYYDNAKLYTSFPDFVYGWLSTFTIDPITKKVRNLGYNDQVDVQARRINIYHALLNTKLIKIWDLEIFKDFLEEKYNPDEIFFYLHCRHLFFHGSQLDNFDATFSVVQWVSLERVDHFLNFMMKKMDEKSIKDILSLVKSRSKYKYGQMFVDISYVLKLLLEYYHNEKKNVYASISEQLLSVTLVDEKKRQYIPFDSYNAFMQERFNYVNDTDRASIYRTAWCIGNGCVDLESFFIAASEMGVFTRNIKRVLANDYSFTGYKLKSMLDSNKSEISVGDVPEYINQNEKLYNYIQDKYEQMQLMFTKCKKFTGNLGVETLNSEINDIERELMIYHQKQSVGSSKGDWFYIQMNKLMQLFVQAKNQYFFAHKNSLGTENEIVQRDLKGFEQILSNVEFYAGLDDAAWLSKMSKVKKLQEFLRKKMSTWYKTLAKLKDKIRQDKSNVVQQMKLNLQLKDGKGVRQNNARRRTTVKLEKKALATFGQKIRDQMLKK